MLKTIELLKYCNLERKDFITDRQRNLIWVTNTNKSCRIKNMTNEHLKNTINFLKQKVSLTPKLHQMCYLFHKELEYRDTFNINITR